MTLQEKIDANIELNNEELKQLNQMIKEQGEQRRKEEEAYLASLPKVEPEKTQEQKWIDGDEPLPNTMKVVNGKLEYKTQQELYKDKVISKEDYSAYQRSIRDSLLQQTDKYLLPDYPVDKARLDVIKKYRQTLRDLPKKKGFPDVDIPKLQEDK